MLFLSRAAALTLFFACLSFFPALSANPLDVAVNEIAWMGTKNSANDEWIELYNNTGNSINLEGWILKAKDGTPEINLTGAISTNGFFLLERTDDNAMPNVVADQIYKGALGNNGEDLKLFDNSGNLIDGVICSSGWFSGDNSTKQTMERKSGVSPGHDSENWQNSQNPGGTPKAQNSIDSIVLTETPEPTKETQKTEEKTGEAGPPPTETTENNLGEAGPPQAYPEGVVFSEILPSPEGPDEIEEWIEIFNQNNFEVNLSGWQIKDAIGSVVVYTMKKDVFIRPGGFLVLSRPETKIVLNNGSDGLSLVRPDSKVADSVSYEKALRGLSYNRTETGWAWSAILTPGSTNIISASTSEPKIAESAFKKEEKTFAGETKEKRGTAAILNHLPAKYSAASVRENLFPFLMALVVAVFSGILIFLLKKRVNHISRAGLSDPRPATKGGTPLES